MQFLKPLIEKDTFFMKDTQFFEKILELKKPWFVREVVLNAEKKEIEIELGLKNIRWGCDKCQTRAHIQGYNNRRWKHLDICQYKTFLTANVPTVICKTHGNQFVLVPWAEKHCRFTKLFERFAIGVLLECSIFAAAELLRITWDEADGIKQRAVKRGLTRKKPKVCEHIGVDEKRFGNGQNYITIVAETGKNNATVEFVGDGNSSESLDEYWKGLNQEQLEGIKSVSMDMSGGYQKSTITHLPDPGKKIVFDKFHIMKHMNDAVNKVRQMEHSSLLEIGDKTLSGTRQIWLYGEERLPEKHQARMEDLKKKNLKQDELGR